MEKQLGNSGKRKKAKQPSRPSSAARPRHLTSGFHLSPTTPSPARPLSPSLCPTGPGCRRRFPRPRALLLSLLCRPTFPVVEPLPPRARSLSLSASWACAVSSAVPAPAVDQRVRALAHVAGNLGHVVRPRVPALFEHRLHPHSLPRLISRSPVLASALSTPSDLAGDPRPPPRSSSSPEATPSDPELRLEVRHPSPRLFSPIHAYM
jgi:hypothetical protein